MLYPHQLPGARLGEKTVLVIRHHWFVFLRLAVGFLLLTLLIVLLGWLLLTRVPLFFAHPIFPPLGIVLANVLGLLLWIFFMNVFIETYLDTWIVTTERIIDIEQHGLFHRTVSELHLNRIQDVTTTSKGISATTFGFGSLTVTTAEATERFQFTDMPDPERVRTLIFKLAKEHEAH